MGQMVPRREIAAGEPLNHADIAEVTEIWFPGLTLQATDRLIYIFRNKWRYGLFYEFNPNGCFDELLAKRDIARIWRRLTFHHLYDTLSNERTFVKLLDSGWFPFNEIAHTEFKKLAERASAGFDLAETENSVIEAFGSDRVDRMLKRWESKPAIQSRMALMKAATSAFLQKEPIAAIKITLTEIEGIMRDALRGRAGMSPRAKTLLAQIKEDGTNRFGGADTISLPSKVVQDM